MSSSSVGRICLYCSKPIASDDRVACCDRCFAAHHETCWDRNGRCSTFQCAGVPRTMRGEDLSTVLHTALERANEQPTLCPFCADRVYAGTLQVANHPHARTKPGRGLLFVARRKPNPHKDWFGRHFLDKMLGNKSWFLSGAALKTRSCGKCHRLFLWGVPVDDAFVVRAREEVGDRYCPHCGGALSAGEIPLRGQNPRGARFECEGVPDFHTDWIGHNLLDRFVMNRWTVPVDALPAHSCSDCQYTEVAGRPIYRFL